MPTLSARSQAFARLHAEPGAFAIANAWDRGSARMLVGLGFEALATTSAGLARSLGDVDYTAGREAALQHCRDLCSAVSVPVTADLENGFGDDPGACAETIRLAGATGLCGGSIEDATGDAANPIYAMELSVERVRAAAEAARSVGGGFLLTARAENFLHGRPDLKDTIARLQAYQDAGADVLYAPGIRTRDEIRTLCSEVDRPVNVLWMANMEVHTLAELGELGARRISVGGSLHAAAMRGMLAMAEPILKEGRFGVGAGDAARWSLDKLLLAGAVERS